MALIRESGMRMPAGMVIVKFWLEVTGPWGSVVGGCEIGARSCANCNEAVNKTATVAVTSLYT
jgi:hypothetical protein